MTDRLVVVETVSGRQEAEILLSYLRAQQIECMLSQEAAGPVIGLTVDGMGKAEILVPSRQRERALEAIARYRSDRTGEPGHSKDRTDGGTNNDIADAAG
jgi:hypothetical protein